MHGCDGWTGRHTLRRVLCRALVSVASSSTLASCGSSSAPDGDDYASSVPVQVHGKTRTILVVTWSQVVAADSTWLEFTFEDDEVLTSRPKRGVVGAHEDVVLGVPADTEVTIRVVSRQG